MPPSLSCRILEVVLVPALAARARHRHWAAGSWPGRRQNLAGLRALALAGRLVWRLQRFVSPFRWHRAGLAQQHSAGQPWRVPEPGRLPLSARLSFRSSRARRSLSAMKPRSAPCVPGARARSRHRPQQGSAAKAVPMASVGAVADSAGCRGLAPSPVDVGAPLSSVLHESATCEIIFRCG